MAQLPDTGSPGDGRRARTTAAANEAQFNVRCPSCGTTYHVPIQYAGKRAACNNCGARVTLPAGPRVQQAAARSAKGARAEEVDRTPEVRIGAIGRGHAGKTALFQALGDGLVGDYLPSGLHLDAADPREVARAIKEAEEAQRLLHRSGLPPTLEVSQTRYCIYQGDERRVVCRMREVIGQVLTHTLPDSHPRLQAQYTNYLKSLVNAHVLWVVVPCPPADPSPRDRRRYSNDLRITGAYLREALRLRTLAPMAAVALVLSKTDAMFPSAAEARAALTDDVLQKALGPLVQMLEQSTHVSDAAIIPVSAFGFGKAVLRDDGTNRHGTDPDVFDEPYADEPIWLLKDGESPAPFNLDTLFLWSLLLGLLDQGAADRYPDLDAVSRMLRDDLESGEAWLVPVKGGVALTTA
jgi:hypothetical protein